MEPKDLARSTCSKSASGNEMKQIFLQRGIRERDLAEIKPFI